MPSMVNVKGTRSVTTDKQPRDESLMTEEEASADIEGSNHSSVGLDDDADTTAKIDAFLHDRCNTNIKQLSTNNDAHILITCTAEINQTRAKMQAFRSGENHKEVETEDCKAFNTMKRKDSSSDAGHGKTIGAKSYTVPLLPRDILINGTGAKHSLYYAVRIGYAIVASADATTTLDDSEESEVDSDNENAYQPIKKRRRIDKESSSHIFLSEFDKENLVNITKENDTNNTTENNNKPTMVKIRSAIFLYWEDVRQFVQHTSSQSPAYKVEYAAFNTFQEAEEYLLRQEREVAMNVAHIAEAVNCCCETDGSLLGEGEGDGAMDDVIADDDNSVLNAIPTTPARNNRATNQSTSYYNNDQQLRQVVNDVLLLQKVSQHAGGMPLSQVSDADLARIISQCTGGGSNISITQQATATPTAPHEHNNYHVSTSTGPSGLFGKEKWNSMMKTQERHNEDSNTPDSSHILNPNTFASLNLICQQHQAKIQANQDELLLQMISQHKSRWVGGVFGKFGLLDSLLKSYLGRARPFSVSTGEVANNESLNACSNKGATSIRNDEKSDATIRKNVDINDVEGVSRSVNEKEGPRKRSLVSDEVERLEAAVAADDHDHETTFDLADPASGDEVANDVDNIDDQHKETEGGHNVDRELSDFAHSDKNANSVQHEQSNGAHLVDNPAGGRVTAETTEAANQKLKKPNVSDPDPTGSMPKKKKRKTKWEEMFGKLDRFRKENDGPIEMLEVLDEKLFRWCKTQQQNSNRLSTERREKLAAMGVHLIDEDTEWNAMLDQAVKYKDDNGKFPTTSIKTADSNENKHLKRWVVAQRQEYKKLLESQPSKLSAHRLQRLNAIGLDLTPATKQQSWSERMESLRKYVEENGHCKPPMDHPLSPFVINVRHFMRLREAGKHSCLTDERVNDLKEIGFVFKAGKTPNRRVTVRKNWDQRFEELLAYANEHGHMLVPCLSGPLGIWVREQRNGYQRMKAGKKTPMTSERALKLSEAGFVFDAEKYKGKYREIPGCENPFRVLERDQGHD